MLHSDWLCPISADYTTYTQFISLYIQSEMLVDINPFHISLSIAYLETNVLLLSSIVLLEQNWQVQCTVPMKKEPVSTSFSVYLTINKNKYFFKQHHPGLRFPRSVFFCPTDRPTFTKGKAMGNETLYGDGLR